MLGSWLIRIIGWDGLLPVGSALIPTVIDLVLPNRPNLIVATAVIFPIAALFLRAAVGGRLIASNNCSNIVRAVQWCAFYAGILLLLCIDAMIVASHAMPPGALFARADDRFAFEVMIIIYLTLMSIAMYPGAGPPTHSCSSSDFER